MNTITLLWTSPPLLSLMPTNDMMALKGSATSIDCVLRDTANKISMNNLVKRVHLKIRCSNMSHKGCKGTFTLLASNAEQSAISAGPLSLLGHHLIHCCQKEVVPAISVEC